MRWILARVLGLAVLLLAPVLMTGPVLAQDDYRIRPGDTLHIEVLEDASLNRTALVTPDGRISVPLAGTVKVSGRSVPEVQAALAEGLAASFATRPNVFVSVDRLADRAPATGGGAAATITVYVMGEAAKGGKYAVAPRTSLLQFFAEIGGFSKFAATKRIQLRRIDAKTGQETIYPINYDAIEQGDASGSHTLLKDGDVIVVPQRRLFE